MSTKPYVPFHRASIGPEEISEVISVLKSGWLTTGPRVFDFEQKFAAYVDCKHAVAVSSCTAALQLALDAIGLQPGDEVILPTYTFTATAEVVTYFGAKPVLCDSIPGAFNIDTSQLENRISPRTRAVIPVHIAGHPCNLDRIQELADRHKLHIIEDAAHGLPSTYRGLRIGGISELTAFSFYATKTITTGEGGMLATQNDDYAARARMMRLHGIGGDAWKRYSKTGSWYYEVVAPGYKANLTDIQAAIGAVQLAKSDHLWRRRMHIAQRYMDAFSSLEELEMPPLSPDSVESWHLFILRLRPERLDIGRNEFIEELKKKGIGTSVHFIPLHLHPFYAIRYGYRRGDFPNAEDAYSRCLSLPIFPGMSDTEIETVIEAVCSTVTEHTRTAVIA